MFVNLAQREADVDQYVIAFANCVKQRDIDVAADASHLYFGDAAGFIHYLDNPTRNRKTHRLIPLRIFWRRPIPFDHGVGHNRLAERNAAVIWRHSDVSEDFESGGFEQPDRPFQKQIILKDAA
jgi:hypothetical protein